jgi:hypothetical protein
MYSEDFLDISIIMKQSSDSDLMTHHHQSNLAGKQKESEKLNEFFIKIK